jgi:phosphohistidine phosphatase
MGPTDARHLIVMRHAKTQSFAGSDHERELTDRGRRDAHDAGVWLVGQGLVPTVVLVSSAVRAQSTAEGVSAELESAPDVRVLDTLYDGDEYDVIEACVAEIPAETGCAIVIGHNPTVTMAANLLQRDSDRQDLALPTSAMAVLRVEGEWAGLAPGIAELTKVYRAAD